MVRQRDRCDVKLATDVRGAECWIDHRLVRSSMSLHVKPPARRVQAKKLNCAYLRTENTRAISQALARAPHPQEFDDFVEDGWKLLTDTLTAVSGEVLGFVSWKNRD